MKRTIALVMLLMFLGSSPCSGLLVGFNLKEMINASSLIAVGTVVEVKESESARPGRKKVAIVRIETIIRGDYNRETIGIYHDPNSSEGVDFSLGERCVYFISPYGTLVQQYEGVVPVKNGKVEVLFIRGEPRDQTLSDFIQKIKEP